MKGHVWKFGDNINTDIISPPAYMELSIEKAAPYTMSTIDKSFAANCAQGDIFVAEKNLGSGSSRETAPLMLKQCGIVAVVAKSFARIFYRNCINVGIVAIVCADTDKIKTGDEIELDFLEGKLMNHSTKEVYDCDKLPPHILSLVECGGLMPYLKTQVTPH